MLNFYFYNFGARLTPDPNIYYRTIFYAVMGKRGRSKPIHHYGALPFGRTVLYVRVFPIHRFRFRVAMRAMTDIVIIVISVTTA